MPASARTGLSDIEGDAWFDAVTLEPLQIDFRYTGLPSSFAAARAGGSIRFRRLVTGHWIADEWSLSVPSGRYSRLFAYDTRDVPSGAGTISLDGVRITTMLMREVQVNGATIYRRAQ